MPIPTVQATDALTQLQAQGVRVPDPATVAVHLAAHPTLITPLLRLVTDAQHALLDAVLSLELYCDPEEPSESLTLYARFEEYPEDVLERIDAVREAHEIELLSLLQSGSGWLFLTTDFEAPANH